MQALFTSASHRCRPAQLEWIVRGAACSRGSVHTRDLDERAALAALRQGGAQLVCRHGVPVWALLRLQRGDEVPQIPWPW
jgi:hypothetical protein